MLTISINLFWNLGFICPCCFSRKQERNPRFAALQLLRASILGDTERKFGVYWGKSIKKTPFFASKNVCEKRRK